MARVLGYREHQVLHLLRADIAERGQPRSYAEIASALGMNWRNNVCDVVRRLERKGFVRRVRSDGDWRLELSGGWDQ
jgi:DNA-binding IclR family transcriptional regulator